MTGNILKWRPDGLSSLNTAVLLSLLIHAVALAVLFFSPLFRRAHGRSVPPTPWTW